MNDAVQNATNVKSLCFTLSAQCGDPVCLWVKYSKSIKGYGKTNGSSAKTIRERGKRTDRLTIRGVRPTEKQNKPDRATMRPGCVSACIDHVTYVWRDRWTNRRVKRLSKHVG